jgi:uncharacterized membrane protein YagU involved in acid resistance
LGKDRIGKDRRRLTWVVIVAGVLVSAWGWGEDSGLPSSKIPADRLQQYSDMAVTWMQEYLRIDTTNPPGHEMRAVEFYKKILDAEGIENRVFEYAPGRGDLWARIAGLRRLVAQARSVLLFC